MVDEDLKQIPPKKYFNFAKTGSFAKKLYLFGYKLELKITC